MFFWWIVPLLLVFVLMDRKSEGSSFWGSNASTGILVFLGILLLGGFGMGFGMMGYGHMGGFRSFGGYGGFGWIGMIINLILVAALVWGAVALFRRNGRNGSAAATEPEEIKVLKLRLAKGEITPEEYDALRQKLQG